MGNPTRSVIYKPITMQEAFDTALVGVLAQGMPSRRSEGSCLYEHDGRQCGIGHGIESVEDRTWLDELTKDNEGGGTAIGGLVSSGLVVISGGLTGQFLQGLQSAHDQAAIGEPATFSLRFRTKMKAFARHWNLEYTEL